MNYLKSLIKEEEGMGTVEIVLIIVVLVALVLIFKKKIVEFVNKILDGITGEGDMSPGKIADPAAGGKN